MMTLADCVCVVESAGGSHLRAMRFEPASFAEKPLWIAKQIPNIQAHNGGPVLCDYDTALAIGCTSYGIYQLLGANIWADGTFTGDVIDFMVGFADEEAIIIQQKAWGRFIGQFGFNPMADVSTWTDEQFAEFITHQNGPGNVAAYMAKMKAAIAAK